MSVKSFEKDNTIAIGKVIAAILVIIGHSGFLSVDTQIYGLGFDATSFIIDTSFIKRLFEVMVGLIYSCHMELFMALSGMVYCICEQKNKYKDIKLFVINKFKRLVIVYFIVSLLFCIPLGAMCGYFGKPIEWIKVFYYLLGFGKNHLWFLIALFYIFIIIRISKNNDLLKRIIFISSVIMNIIVNKVYITECFYIDKLMMYLIWFIIGIEIQKKIKIIDDLNKRDHLIGSMGFACFWSGFYLLEKITESYIIDVLTSTSGVLFFIIFSNTIFKYYSNITDNKIFNIISNKTYDLYLYGTPINYIIFAILSNLYDDRHPLILNNIMSLVFIIIRICCQLVIPLGISLLLEKFGSLSNKRQCH